jgi:hypothetical protein
MTAIYAYAEGEIAFVGADTRRVDPNGLPRQVCKVRHWSDQVVLAQAGEAQFLTQLIEKILPLAGFFPFTDEGFIDAFQNLNHVFWNKAEALYAEKQAGPVPEGIVLVAAAATENIPARIHKVSFQTGEAILNPSRIEADGTDPQQFKSDAEKHFHSLQAGQEAVSVPLDHWAALCVADAARAHPIGISFPTDALIVRSASIGQRIIVQRRLSDASVNPIGLFATS